MSLAGPSTCGNPSGRGSGWLAGSAPESLEADAWAPYRYAVSVAALLIFPDEVAISDRIYSSAGMMEAEISITTQAPLSDSIGRLSSPGSAFWLG